jgi:hypothetical protein
MFWANLTPSSRKAFLKFVTARVRLPAGGLRALGRKIEVRRLRSEVPAADGGASPRPAALPLPPGHTCSLALDLPPYASQVCAPAGSIWQSSWLRRQLYRQLYLRRQLYLAVQLAPAKGLEEMGGREGDRQPAQKTS